MWMKTKWRLPRDAKLNYVKGWRGVLKLAQEISIEPANANINPSTTSDSALKSMINKHLNGGNVSFLPVPRCTNRNMGTRLQQFLEKEKRWLLGVTTFLCFCTVALFGIWTTFVVLEALIVVNVGTTVRNRCFLTVFWVLLALLMLVKPSAGGL